MLCVQVFVIDVRCAAAPSSEEFAWRLVRIRLGTDSTEHLGDSTYPQLNLYTRELESLRTVWAMPLHSTSVKC